MELIQPDIAEAKAPWRMTKNELDRLPDEKMRLQAELKKELLQAQQKAAIKKAMYGGSALAAGAYGLKKLFQ